MRLGFPPGWYHVPVQERFARETVVPPTADYASVKPATELRGTMLSSSIGLLREHGREALYFQRLPSSLHEVMRNVEPLAWIDMETALVHYHVMNEVYPGGIEQIENGRLIGARTFNTYVKTLLRAMSVGGQLDPTVLLRKLVQGTERSMRGGGALAAYRTGPKDARIEMVAFPILSIPYVRHAFQGIFEVLLAPTAKRVFVREDSSFGRNQRIALSVSWV
jgi:hypothetical protein